MKFLFDENFTGAIIRALLSEYPDLDAIRVQDTRQGIPDNKVLEWAASENRIVLTHDIRTMPAHAYDRVKRGLPMPGVIEIKRMAGVGEALEMLKMVIEVSQPEEWENQVKYLP